MDGLNPPGEIMFKSPFVSMMNSQPNSILQILIFAIFPCLDPPFPMVKLPFSPVKTRPLRQVHFALAMLHARHVQANAEFIGHNVLTSPAQGAQMAHEFLGKHDGQV